MEKKIQSFVLQGQSPSTEIGRVYVYDRDDWDIADKTFKWLKAGFLEILELLCGVQPKKNGFGSDLKYIQPQFVH